MPLKKKFIFESTFHLYTAIEIVGEGGAGKIFSAKDESGDIFAIKLLDPNKATKNKIKRFENEIHFCFNNNHPHIISVNDHGLFKEKEKSSLFYVMSLYSGSLKNLIESAIAPDKVLKYFNQILLGVEAAHLKSVIHRDLKPENILYDKGNDHLLIGDFGIAHFEEEDLYTAVKTKDSDRLANFQYAAPEQKTRGQSIDHRADIYALGLMLNEMFTKKVPHGSNYKTIGSIRKDFEYLDKLVSEMICQSPEDRPESIEAVQKILIGYKNTFITRQKINELENTVIPTTSINDDPLISDPPRLVDANWDRDQLTLILSRPVNSKWNWALHNMGGHTSVWGKGPEIFNFHKNEATIAANADDVQRIIDYFKTWLPRVNGVYKQKIEREKREAEEKLRMELEREIELQKTRERVLKEIEI